MPSFNNIDNGESGLSVRNTLNEVIDFVNTGITSGFTFITEDTTVGSENVIISVTDGTTTGQIETFGDGTINISSTDGSNSGSINTLVDGTINISSIDGGGDKSSSQIIIPNDVTTLVDTTTGTPGAYDATFIDVKGNFRVQILDDSLSSFFNIANDIVIYFPSDDSTFNPIDIDQITIIVPSGGLPNGATQLHLNGAQGISNTFVGEQCFVITPDLGGAGTETIPTLPIVSTSTITLNSTQVLLNRSASSSTNEIDISDNSIVLSSTDGVDTNVITLTPTNVNISNIPAFDDDTDASTLSTGDLYQTTGLGASPLDVAGILMIKQ